MPPSPVHPRLGFGTQVGVEGWLLVRVEAAHGETRPCCFGRCLLGLIVGDGDGGREGDRWVSTDPGTNASDCGSGTREARSGARPPTSTPTPTPAPTPATAAAGHEAPLDWNLPNVQRGRVVQRDPRSKERSPAADIDTDTDPGTNASDCGSGSRGASRLELAERATRESGAAGPAKQGAEPGRRHRSGRQPSHHRPPGGHKTLPYQSRALLGFSPTVYLLAQPPSSSSRPVVSGVTGPTIGLETSSSERVIALPSASART